MVGTSPTMIGPLPVVRDSRWSLTEYSRGTGARVNGAGRVRLHDQVLHIQGDCIGALLLLVRVKTGYVDTCVNDGRPVGFPASVGVWSGLGCVQLWDCIRVTGSSCQRLLLPPRFHSSLISRQISSGATLQITPALLPTVLFILMAPNTFLLAFRYELGSAAAAIVARGHHELYC